MWSHGCQQFPLGFRVSLQDRPEGRLDLREHLPRTSGGEPSWPTRPPRGIAALADLGATIASLVAMAVNAVSVRRLSGLPHTDFGEDPPWSSDGRRIAFSSNRSGQGLMYIVDVDGSRVVDLSRAGQGHEVAWSPDGRSMLFASVAIIRTAPTTST
jgi:dipeptidyl aminopeptidase/acylaminoacyl peptidase